VLDYGAILTAILPVYMTMLAGGIARKTGLLPAASDAGLMRLSVNLLFPCLILERMVGNAALLDAGRVLLGAGLGFSLVALGTAISYLLAPFIGLKVGEGRRTFAMANGIQNYGFVAIPVISALFPGKGTLGVMFTFTLGVEIAVWTVGVGVITGLARAPWKAFCNTPVISIITALLLNALGVGDYVPEVLHSWLRYLGDCSVPLSVLLVGASITELLGQEKPRWGVALLSPVVRLALIPIAFFAAARLLPVGQELQRVLLVQAAMPAAVFGIVVARMYGGHGPTAVHVVLSTTAVSLVTTPLVIQAGARWLGLVEG
jgi:malate permease and related proteins